MFKKGKAYFADWRVDGQRRRKAFSTAAAALKHEAEQRSGGVMVRRSGNSSGRGCHVPTNSKPTKTGSRSRSRKSLAATRPRKSARRKSNA